MFNGQLSILNYFFPILDEAHIGFLAFRHSLFLSFPPVSVPVYYSRKMAGV